MVGAITGAWCGVIPIALDWDRPWQVRTPNPHLSQLQLSCLQAWPLTPAYGAVFGHVLGSLAAFLVSSVYLLAQANIQAIAELEKTKKAPQDETLKTKLKAKKKAR